jgi:hypothetical protein
MSHTEYSAQFVQYSSVFLGLEEALVLRGKWTISRVNFPLTSYCKVKIATKYLTVLLPQ